LKANIKILQSHVATSSRGLLSMPENISENCLITEEVMTKALWRTFYWTTCIGAL